jgi:hypothetical protein
MEKVDFTDEVQKQFQARQRYGRLGDGRYVELGQAHHRDASGNMVLIPGADVVELGGDEARRHGVGYATLDDAAEGIGAKREGDRFFIEDNFNSRWDWWVIGGRYGSTLKLLPGRQGYTAMLPEFDPEFAKILNRPPPEIWQPTPGYCDQARKKDIDWVGMATEAAGAKADAESDLVFVHDALSGAGRFMLPERKSAGVPYAVVLDGQWLGSDTVDQETDADWNRQFHAILDRVADEAMVTIVDCHV